MSDCILLKKSPKIEFQLLERGFQLVDEQSVQNSGFYAYRDLQAIELNKVWYPSLSKWLRAITWIFNGAPFFPDSESCKKANVMFHFKKMKLGLWLTDSYMAGKARMLKEVLDKKRIHDQSVVS